VPEEQGHRRQVDGGDRRPGGRSAHPPRQRFPQEQRQAGLGDAERHDGEGRRVQVRDGGAVDADHAGRVPGPQDECRGGRGTTGEHQGRPPAPGERTPGPGDAEQVGDQPARYHVDPAGPGRAAEVEPDRVRGGDDDQRERGGEHAEPAHQGDGQRGQRGEHRVHAQEPQRVEHQREHGVQVRPGHAAAQVQSRRERRPDRGEHQHRPGQPGQALPQPRTVAAVEAAGSGIPADQEEDRERLEDPGHRGEHGHGGQRARVVQRVPGPAAGHYQRGDQPVAEDDTGDGQRAERVHRTVPVRRGGGVDPGGKCADPGDNVAGHRVTPAGSPSAM
jgi:hypothetical protein